jgi:tetratricopeptide (TPR) repeat protein
MKLSFIQPAGWAVMVAFVSGLAFGAVSHAQMSTQGGQQASPVTSGVDSLQTQLHMLTDVQRQHVDSKEKRAYEAFYKVNREDLDKKIQLGNEFLQKYPKSPLAEAVDAGLVTAYYNKQDWKGFYAAADNALALKPDDVDVLTTVGWVIPHFFNPNDPDVDARLDKAESFEKRAIQALEKMPKPDYLSESQFAALKAEKSIQAHSALGLVYFRREDYDNSVKELQQATQNNPSPDQTDLFVLGESLVNQNRYAEAAEAFDRCGQMSGSLQDRCKQNAAGSKKQAAQSKSK